MEEVSPIDPQEKPSSEHLPVSGEIQTDDLPDEDSDV